VEASYKSKHRSTIWSSNPTTGDIPIRMQHSYSRGTCTPMFFAALFTIVKLWKQPRCPSTEEWIKKMCYLHTIEFYSAIKKNEILLFSNKWMELENIILSEVSQTQKTKNCKFSHMQILGLGQIQQCCWTWVTHSHMGSMGIGRKPKTWKCLMSPLQRSQCRNLKTRGQYGKGIRN
jgi:hypothetical protein